MKQDCEVIQDLISMGNKAGRASTRMITDHIQTCETCRAYYYAARKGWRFRPRKPIENPGRDIQLRYFTWSLMALAVMTTLICMVVNYAIDGVLSWGWFVLGALVTSTVPVLVYIRSYSNRFLKALVCFSVLVLFLLGLIQYVFYAVMGTEEVWFWKVALPIAAIWLAVIWIGVLTVKWRDANGFHCLSTIMLLCVPADIGTGAIAAAYLGNAFSIHWIYLIVYVAAAAAFWAMGMMFDMRENKRKNDAK